MLAHFRIVALAIVALICAPHAARGQQNRSLLKHGGDDRPQVAIIQYESGRVVVLRAVDGQLQAVEAPEREVEMLRRYLSAGRLSAGSAPAAPPEEDDPAVTPETTPIDRFRPQDPAAREELALLSYDVLLREGLEFFHNRQYGQAARSFIGAAMKDQGDAASRLHAAQALLASGMYDQALSHVTRAFELAPGLINRPLNHRANYTHPQDYDAHLLALEAYIKDHPEDGAALVLLAYEKFFSSDPAAAREVLITVKQRAAADPFARKLLAAAEPLVGRL